MKSSVGSHSILKDGLDGKLCTRNWNISVYNNTLHTHCIHVAYTLHIRCIHVASNPTISAQYSSSSTILFLRGDVIEQLRSRTERFKFGFYPNFIKKWSILDPQKRIVPPVEVVIRYILSIARPNANSVFGIYGPKNYPT